MLVRVSIPCPRAEFPIAVHRGACASVMSVTCDCWWTVVKKVTVHETVEENRSGQGSEPR